MNKLMDRVIGFDLEPQVFVYLDDIVIATKTFAEHLRLLKLVAERLNKGNLTISLDKSRFCRKQVSYLGYLLTEEGVAIDNSRIAPILDYARPRSVKDIRRLLGLAGFYQRFIKEYSRIVTPISDLLKKSKQKFVWTEAAEGAFNELKSALVSAPILGNPSFDHPFVIESDASDNAVGAALIQHIEGEPRVIAYFSKKLSSTQRKYAAVEKECLGVLLAIEHFRHYVEGTRFKIVTDARSLTWLFTMGVGTGNAKLLRWALKIQSYDIELEYRKGRNNILADCLSRSVEAINSVSTDEKYEELLEKICKNPADYPHFHVVDGTILKYAKVEGRIEDPRFQWKRYPKKTEHLEIIQSIHDQAHLGTEKTLAAVKEREASAESLSQFVETFIFLLFGVPEVILTDNGSQFVSSTFENLLTKYGVTHWKTPYYHPQVNDSERVNRVITTAIRASIKKEHKEWANNIQAIANAVRNSVHEATRYTPYFLLFGRNKVSNGQEYRQLRDAPGNNDGQLGKEERDQLFDDVRKNLKTAYEKHASYYNLRSNSNCATYSVGETVLKKNTEQSDKGKGFCGKLAPKFVQAIKQERVRRLIRRTMTYLSRNSEPECVDEQYLLEEKRESECGEIRTLIA
ncbi:uncharacterized protein LOC129741468 [Uranotaenia lowii]|uniref:uncharacterized protein LOC129741468 n=1 Tax=Uranotaenia lowii TaxID=190385 RepID=UPI00247A0DFD|nr:uncharacterized protein LOC129741468 [Uranotaenia lowii]